LANTAAISASLVLSETLQDHEYSASVLCLLPSLHWYWLHLTMKGSPGWVDLGGYYIPRWFTHPQI